MATKQVYEITKVEPRLYLAGGQAVNGHHITAFFPDFNESVEVDVPRLDASLVHDRVMELYNARVKLLSLGTVEDK